MNAKKRLRDYLDKIYIPIGKKNLVKQLLFYVDAVDVRLPNCEDAHTTGQSILIIETKGKGTRESFSDFRVEYVDFTTIGEKYALAYVYDASGYGKPCRMDITSIKNLIIYRKGKHNETNRKD